MGTGCQITVPSAIFTTRPSRNVMVRARGSTCATMPFTSTVPGTVSGDAVPDEAGVRVSTGGAGVRVSTEAAGACVSVVDDPGVVVVVVVVVGTGGGAGTCAVGVTPVTRS